MKDVTTNIKALAGIIRKSADEIALYLAISIGLPFIAYMYIDLRAALTVFIITQIALLALKVRLG